MKKINLLASVLVSCLFFLACAEEKPVSQEEVSNQEPAAQVTPKPAYVDLDVAAFKEKMEDPNVVILDVRTPAETSEGIIEGAIEADIKNKEVFKGALQSLDKEKTYLVYCRGGVRSTKACEAMHKQGFTNLYNLEGGYLEWSKE